MEVGCAWGPKRTVEPGQGECLSRRRPFSQPGLYVSRRRERDIPLGHDCCPPASSIHVLGPIPVVGRGTSWILWFDGAGKVSGAGK